MSIIVAVDAHVRLCMQIRMHCQPCMLMDGDVGRIRQGWMHSMNMHGVQPVGLHNWFKNLKPRSQPWDMSFVRMRLSCQILHGTLNGGNFTVYSKVNNKWARLVIS
jgi:hypothetical protein